MAEVSLPDGEGREVIVIGQIDGPDIARQVGHFVREVERVKNALVGKKVGSSPPRNQPFTPEFSGPRRSYRLDDEIQTNATHGLVVDGIVEVLKAQGIPYNNDQNRDLYVLDRAGRATVLFEVKTNVATTSIYTAVGQLILNGIVEGQEPARVLVLPETPKPKTRAALQKVGINVATYRWRGEHPVFSGLKEIVGKPTASSISHR